MNKKEIYELIDKVNQGIATDEEMYRYTFYLNQMTSGDPEWNIDELGSEDGVRIELFDRIETTIGKTERRTFRLWPRIAVAASILFVLSAGTYLLYKQPSPPPAIVQLHDLAPGSNQAVITLSNGKQINLAEAQNGVIAKEDNATVVKGKNGVVSYDNGSSASNREIGYNTITTPPGGQWKVVLPDGTNVMLDAASSIRYPVKFDGKERLVTITGQAYLEVAHNASKPFRVSSIGQTVVVLGTHFNINAYTNEPAVKTTLLEGSVKVVSGIQKAVLKPGQQARVKDNSIGVADVDVSETVAWKDGYFEFSTQDIQSVMRQISRWYNVDVVFEGPVTKETFTGRISRFKNISQVLKLVQASNSVHVSIQGRRIMVK